MSGIDTGYCSLHPERRRLGGHWIAVRDRDRWTLAHGGDELARATVTIDGDVAWRLWTRGISPAEARSHMHVSGDPQLGAGVLEMVSIIA